MSGQRELFGFLNESVFGSTRESSDARSRMAAFAERWDYCLAKVYAEKPDAESDAFDQLRAAVAGAQVPVVVPSAAHLAPYGDLPTVVAELERSSGHAVLASEAY
ncbi:hypothetical protein HPO96_35105 [Kribbella sandramycini]|uniref:Uncharacterized protein n=1 Tax=Kribbella sandramycini TaxID=60450 RepID=A0A7Y4L6W9_9ACTN|nr:hypothetical protein [Kribbella sandramycini]MBB6566702.1 hypothetical protein [Kribbella sandramycini]NOL45489.1 hypothetical protein [Kribbella sandramycini]